MMLQGLSNQIAIKASPPACSQPVGSINPTDPSRAPKPSYPPNPQTARCISKPQKPPGGLAHTGSASCKVPIITLSSYDHNTDEALHHYLSNQNGAAISYRSLNATRQGIPHTAADCIHSLVPLDPWTELMAKRLEKNRSNKASPKSQRCV